MAEETTKKEQKIPEQTKTTSEKNNQVVEKKDSNDNIVFIGNKPLVNYIKGVITQFNRKNAKEVVIKSRGKFISKAVDVAEVAKRSLSEKKVYVKSISIASESFETQGKKTNISTIDIVLSI